MSSKMSAGAQREFLQWAIQWFSADFHTDTLVKPDVSDVVCLLQSVGFKLRDCERLEDTKIKPETLAIVIECGSSRIRATMDLNSVTCKCSNDSDTRDASFWSISATGPTGSADSVNKIEECGSSLLPKIPKDLGTLIKDVTNQMLIMIESRRNAPVQATNSNTSSRRESCGGVLPLDIKRSTLAPDIGLTRCHTQPEIQLLRNRTFDKKDYEGNGSTISEEAAVFPKPVPFPRQSTTLYREYDSPRMEPPTILASSPVQLCSSLDYISLPSEDWDRVSFKELISKAHQYLGRALQIVSKHVASAPSSNSSLMISEHDAITKMGSPNDSLSSARRSRAGSTCSMPSVGIATRQKVSTGIPKPSLLAASRGSMAKKKSVRETLSMSMSSAALKGYNNSTKLPYFSTTKRKAIDSKVSTLGDTTTPSKGNRSLVVSSDTLPRVSKLQRRITGTPSGSLIAKSLTQPKITLKKQ